MNLIEQLGGYEKSKEIVFDPLHPQMTHVSNDGRHWVNEEFSHIPEIQEQIPTMVRIEDIRKALLDYRRQHNIFEAGDKVVFVNQNMSSSVKVVKEILNDTHVSFNFHGFHIELIRHATDAEIAAGKRL